MHCYNNRPETVFIGVSGQRNGNAFNVKPPAMRVRDDCYKKITGDEGSVNEISAEECETVHGQFNEMRTLVYLYTPDGLVLHVLRVPAGVTILFERCLAANYTQAALERQRVTRTFQRYVAPEIISELMGSSSDALRLGGKKCDIAVLFVDIRGTLDKFVGTAPWHSGMHPFPRRIMSCWRDGLRRRR